MGLKPQDVMVALKTALRPGERWTFVEMATSLGMSSSEVHAAVGRLVDAKLLVEQPRGDTSRFSVNRAGLLEFLRHGVKYAFAPRRGAVTRGVPTAHAAPPLVTKLAPSDELPPVWPSVDGTVRGEAFEPLYPSAVVAARNDERLYAGLALIDAIRGGRARERKLAEDLLEKVLAR